MVSSDTQPLPRRKKLYVTAVYLLGIAVFCTTAFKSLAATGAASKTSEPQNNTNFPMNKMRNFEDIVNSKEMNLHDPETSPRLAREEAEVLRRQKGVYVNPTRQPPHLKNVILVTAANYAYLDMYRNWACYASQLGLKWVLVALDNSIYNEVSTHKTKHEDLLLSYSSDRNITKKTKFRKRSFNFLSCSKLLMVAKIAHAGGLDVVFSDPDNIFLKDPFAEGASLGDAMRNGKYEYIYQPNSNKAPSEDWNQSPPHEGNTGFYFVSGTKKRQGIKSLFLSALTECRQNPRIDDQANFWNAFRSVRNGELEQKWLNNTNRARERYGHPFSNASFCPSHAVEDDSILSYCPMSPFQHPTGYPIEDKEQIVTYHANYVVGRDAKLAKMKKLGVWSWENETCQIKERGST